MKILEIFYNFYFFKKLIFVKQFLSKKTFYKMYQDIFYKKKFKKVSTNILWNVPLKNSINFP